MRSTRWFSVLAGLSVATATGCDRGSRIHESAGTVVPSIDSLPSPTGPGAAQPNLAVGPRGEVYLSWHEPADSGHMLKVAQFSDDRWSSPSIVRTGRDFFVNWADFPSVLPLGQGRLAVHWLQRSGTGPYAYGVRIATSPDNGKTWSRPVQPHRDQTTGEHGFVAMWPDKAGFGAAWLDGRNSHGEGHGGQMQLMATTMRLDGTLGAEVVVDAKTCDCCQNSVAVASSGPIVAYRDRTDGEIRDIYVSRLVNGKWTPGAAVFNDNWKINACPVNGPAIGASGSNVAVAWFTGARDTNKVQVAFSTNAGAKFGAPIRIDAGQPAGRVGLVMLDDGSALVSWLERTGGDVAAVMARRVSPRGTVGEPRTIATSTARATGVPRMAIAGGDIYFAWTVPTRPSSVRVARASSADFK